MTVGVLKVISTVAMVLLNVSIALCAESVSDRVDGDAGPPQGPTEQLSRAAGLIAEVNAVETNFYVNGAPCTNRLASTNRFTTGTPGQRRRSNRLKWQLVEQGTTIRYVNGHYVDATAAAENGHALSSENKRILAELNYFEQTLGIVPKEIVGPRYVTGGKTRVWHAKEQLTEKGISVAWDATNKLYFVTSTNVPAAKPTPRPPWEKRQSP